VLIVFFSYISHYKIIQSSIATKTMSSRALRRLQRERDTELGTVSQCTEAKADDSCDTTPEETTQDTADFVDHRHSVNHETSPGPTNLFDLV